MNSKPNITTRIKHKILGRKKRILFVNHEETRTGAPIILMQIAESLLDDFEVTMVSLKKGSLHDKFSSTFENVIYPTEKYPNREKSVRASKIIEEFQPDIVYANTVVNYHYATEARKRGIPIIFHIHELFGQFKIFLDQQQIEDFKNQADVFIADSEKVYELLTNKIGTPKNKTKLIPEFISSEQVLEKSLHPSIKPVYDDLKENKDEKLLVTIGTACKRKGTDLLIEAYELLNKKSKTNFRFIWIGDDSNNFASKLPGNHDRFKFIGESDNPYPYIAASDIFVLPSREEPLGMVLLEAMAVNKPVIVYKEACGLAKEIENKCGLAIKNISASALADAIVQLSSDDKMMEKFAQAGPQVQKNFDKTTILPKFKALIHEMVGKR